MTKSLLVGEDGKLYVEKDIGPADAPHFKAILPAGAADLPEARVKGPSLSIANLPKLKVPTVLFVHKYFQEVYKRWKSESIVLFHRAEGDADYTVVVPEHYEASATHLTYNPNQQVFCSKCRICSTEEVAICPRGCKNDDESASAMIKLRVMGTAHSHGSMGAFHSGTDDAHEKNQTGFHITFGNVDKAAFNICPSFVVALFGYTPNGYGYRFYPQPEDLIDVPLAEAELSTIGLWLTTLTDSKVLEKLPDPTILVVNLQNEVLYQDATEELAQLWISRQPVSRQLRLLTVYEYKQTILTKKNQTSSKSGSSITKPRELGQVGRNGLIPLINKEPITAGADQRTERKTDNLLEKPKTDGSSDKTSGDSTDYGILFEHKIDKDLSVMVENDFTITVTVGTEIDNFACTVLSDLQKELQPYAFVYTMQVFANMLDDATPKYTGTAKGIDGLVDKTVTAIQDLFGDDISEVMENVLKTWVLHKGTNKEITVPSSIVREENRIKKLLDDIDADFPPVYMRNNKEEEEPEDVDKKVAAGMLVTIGAVQVALEFGLEKDLIVQNDADKIGDALDNCIKCLLEHVAEIEEIVSEDSDGTVLGFNYGGHI